MYFYLRTKCYYLSVQHLLICVYDLNVVCLLRGTN